MRVQVHLFAAASQLCNARTVAVDVAVAATSTASLADTATLADIAQAIDAQYPQLRSLLPISRWAVDHQFVSLDTTVHSHQEIALIPPVSGG